MPLYEFRCACGRLEVRWAHMDDEEGRQPGECVCGNPMKRVFGFAAPRVFIESFSPSLGRHISSRRDFLESAKKLSDKATKETGIPHDFQPVDPMEVAPKDPSALVSTFEAARQGRRTPLHPEVERLVKGG